MGEKHTFLTGIWNGARTHSTSEVCLQRGVRLTIIRVYHRHMFLGGISVTFPVLFSYETILKWSLISATSVWLSGRKLENSKPDSTGEDRSFYLFAGMEKIINEYLGSYSHGSYKENKDRAVNRVLSSEI